DGIRDLTVTGVQTCALPISDGQAAAAMPDNYQWLLKEALADVLGYGTILPDELHSRIKRLLGVPEWCSRGPHWSIPEGHSCPERSEERRVGKECRSQWCREE